ncbi:Frag1/DRAM/Sfk1 family-domain-containing protein [Crepidotus variabilis]|uniref:Frag1/DRAM/Sfk1 family-domain-containing protein n=1 Tax=Crepidotus variabilis TaxID=179855 RepID=A0A9P6ERT9_9AGAR|nr:Frag1/DRAM/Sfk1 family-domain-containing protein [Crepidotus variabilis]
MALLPLRYQHWTHVWLPILGAFIWFGTLLSMLITWLATGRPRYPSQDGSIAYISDVGASYLKPLFIVGCCITAVCFFLSLAVERWLRHAGRLMPNMRTRERVLGSLAVFGAFIGGAGLVLLSIFDTARYTKAHRVFLLVFMLGVALSAIFTVLEYRWISKAYKDIEHLKKAYILKMVIASILILLAVGFAIALFSKSSSATNAGAILEWIISFGFTFYLLTFYLDLRKAKNVQKGELKGYNGRRNRRSRDIEMNHGRHGHGHSPGGSTLSGTIH